MNKAPGIDGIPGEIFKHGGHRMVKKLTKLIEEIWKQERVPQDFKRCQHNQAIQERKKVNL